MRAHFITLLAAATLVASSGVAALALDASNGGALGAAVGIDGSTANSTTNNTDIKSTTITPSETTNVSKENGNTVASDNTVTKTSTDNTTITKTSTDNTTVNKESGNNIASGNSATKTTTVTKTDNSTENKGSFNTLTDNSKNIKTEDSFNKQIETEDSYNKVSNTKNETENEDSFNTTTKTENKTETENKGSFNTISKTVDTADDHSVNVTVGDVAVAVSSTALSGTVSSNSIRLAPNTGVSTGNNDISGAAFQNAAGITAVSQNTGVNSLLQQSVNVQSNMSLNPTR